MLIDGCLYIYSELDLESPARGADHSDDYEDDDDREDDDSENDDDDDHHHDQE